MNQWQIGDVRITRVVELEVAGGSRFILPDATPEAVKPIAWLTPHFATPAGKLIMSVHALVIDTGRRRILVDTCIGNDKERAIPAWSHLTTRFLSDLAAAGYPRETIDTVLCTHLHVDHVGWNTMRSDGRWVATFPNARYLIARPEWHHWADSEGSEWRTIDADSIGPVFNAGLVDLIETDAEVAPGVTVEPSPGHTPGHVSVNIRSRGEHALVTGDFLHHPCQMARLDWGSSADAEPARADATRRSMLERLAGTPVLAIGTHFATPTAGYVVADGTGYRLHAV